MKGKHRITMDSKICEINTFRYSFSSYLRQYYKYVWTWWSKGCFSVSLDLFLKTIVMFCIGHSLFIFTRLPKILLRVGWWWRYACNMGLCWCSVRGIWRYFGCVKHKFFKRFWKDVLRFIILASETKMILIFWVFIYQMKNLQVIG